MRSWLADSVSPIGIPIDVCISSTISRVLSSMILIELSYAAM